MKRTSCLLALAVLPALLHARTVVRGTCDNNEGQTVTLCRCIDGHDESRASSEVAADGTFSLSCDAIDEGYYVVVSPSKVRHAVYLRDGMEMEVVLSEGVMKIVEGYPESLSSQLLWEEAVRKPLLHAAFHVSVPGASTVESGEFCAEMSGLREVATRLLSHPKVSVADSLLALRVRADMAFAVIAYEAGHGIEQGGEAMVAGALSETESLFADSRFASLPFAADMLVAYVNLVAAGREIARDDYVLRSQLLSRPILQESYLCKIAQGMRFYEHVTDLQQRVSDSGFSPYFQSCMEQAKERLAWSRPGQPAPAFKGMTPDGGELSLNQFRGKVVVIDVWATWCVPCIKMMPHFKRLAAELDSPDVEFLSVCLGVSVEIDRWKQLIAKHQMKGNLIFIDSWTKGFAKDYNVSSVPRFIVIDRNGNIASYSAPAPNTPRLKQLVVGLLNDK